MIQKLVPGLEFLYNMNLSCTYIHNILLTVQLTVSKEIMIAIWKASDLCYKVTEYLVNLLPAIIWKANKYLMNLDF